MLITLGVLGPPLTWKDYLKNNSTGDFMDIRRTSRRKPFIPKIGCTPRQRMLFYSY